MLCRILDRIFWYSKCIVYCLAQAFRGQRWVRVESGGMLMTPRAAGRPANLPFSIKINILISESSVRLSSQFTVILDQASMDFLESQNPRTLKKGCKMFHEIKVGNKIAVSGTVNECLNFTWKSFDEYTFDQKLLPVSQIYSLMNYPTNLFIIFLQWQGR